MATADMEVKISLEKCLNDGIKNFVQQFGDENGIFIQSIDVSWFYGSTVNSKPKRYIEKISISTESM